MKRAAACITHFYGKKKGDEDKGDNNREDKADPLRSALCKWTLSLLHVPWGIARRLQGRSRSSERQRISFLEYPMKAEPGARLKL